MADDNEDRIAGQAISWFALLRDEQATQADRDAFARWLADDLRHEAAWHEVEALWSGLDALGPAKPDKAPAPSLVTTAGVAMIGGGRVAANDDAQEKTGIGEIRMIELPDGSTAELDTASALSSEFGNTVRRVVLHTGQSFFVVAKDPARPFIVEAAGGQVRAVGTAFNVRIDERAASVAVVEGTVEVTRDGRSVLLDAGQQVSYGAFGLGKVTGADLEAIGAWRLHELVFDGAPLSDVVRDLQRHRHGWILLMDDEVAKLAVNGAFDVRDPDAALAAICRQLPVKMRNLTDRLVVIESV